MLIDFRQLERGQRGGRGRLDDDGVARGQGRPHLVGHQVEGKIKGRNAQNRTQGKAPGYTPPAPAGGGQIEWYDLAPDSGGLLGRQTQGEHAPGHLAPGVGDGFAAFRHDGLGQFLLAVLDPGCQLFQHLLALQAGETLEGDEGLLGRSNGRFPFACPGQGNLPHRFSGPGGEDRKLLFGFHPGIVDETTFPHLGFLSPWGNVRVFQLPSSSP